MSVSEPRCWISGCKFAGIKNRFAAIEILQKGS